MYITAQQIITAGAVVSAILLLAGIFLKAYRWYLARNKNDSEIAELKNQHITDIQHIKNENTLICFALSACLDGLEQLGANHSVAAAKDKLEKYLNMQAHE